MKVNEARLFFRCLAAILAILSGGLAAMDIWRVSAGSELSNDEWQFLATSLFGSISFGIIAISGYMPKALLRIWTYGGPVADEKDLK